MPNSNFGFVLFFYFLFFLNGSQIYQSKKEKHQIGVRSPKWANLTTNITSGHPNKSNYKPTSSTLVGKELWVPLVN